MDRRQQIRAARALLGISDAELAERSAVSHRTLQRFEAQDGIPESRSGNLETIERVLAELGILLIGDPLTFCAGIMRVNFRLFVVLVTIGKAGRYAAVVMAAASVL